MLETEGRGSQSEASTGQNARPYLKNKAKKRAGDMVKVIREPA
jgi:hypothetical protein